MEKLFLNNELVDLSPGTVISLTSVVNDISDIETRNGNHTNEFELQKTATNRRVLGNPDLFSNNNLIYTRFSARYMQDGIEIIAKGYAVCDEASDVYKITLYSSNSYLFDLIGDGDLTTLDLGFTFNLTWNDINIKSAISGGLINDCYTYPMIDYGNMPATGIEVKTHYLFPAIYAKYLFTKIFTDLGYTLEGDILTDQRFINLILPWCRDKWEHSQEVMDGYKTNTTNPDILQTGNVAPINTYCSFEFNLKDADYILNNEFTPGNTLYAANFKLSANIRTYNYSNPGAPQGPIIYKLRILKDGITAFDTGAYGSGIYPEASPDEDNFRINLSAAINVEPTSKYTLVILLIHDKSTFNFEISDLTFEIDYDGNNIKDNAGFILSDQLPDMSKKDFIKGILQLFGLSVSVNENTKVVKLNNFEKLRTNKYKARDWSAKLDDKGNSIVFRGDNYFQNNIFVYEKDDYIPANFGDGIFTISDDMLELNGNVVESIFGSGKSESRLLNEGGYIDVPFIDKIDDAFNPTNASTQRILILEPTELLFDIDLVNDFGDTPASTSTLTAGTLVPLAYFVKTGGAHNLDWQTLLTDYYDTFIGTFDKLKVLKAKFNLNAVDIYNFDHFVPVYIQKYNSYFYVNSINDFKAGFLTEVELIKINI